MLWLMKQNSYGRVRVRVRRISNVFLRVRVRVEIGVIVSQD